jgi:hypothetical protein
MRFFGSRQLVFVPALVLGLVLVMGEALAQDRLTQVGARLSMINIEASRVTVSRQVVVGDDAVTGTYVTAHTASGKALQRNHLGFWVPWDGRLATLADNHFSIVGGSIVFKILKDEDMSGELFPVRVMLAYRTQSALKFGVFDLRETGSETGR